MEVHHLPDHRIHGQPWTGQVREPRLLRRPEQPLKFAGSINIREGTTPLTKRPVHLSGGRGVRRASPDIAQSRGPPVHATAAYRRDGTTTKVHHSVAKPRLSCR